MVIKLRKFKDGLLRGLLWFSAFLTIAVLITIVGFRFDKGFESDQFLFIFSDYSPVGGGGIWPMIGQPLQVIVISLVIATPIGILAAVYLERRQQGRLVRTIFCH